MGFMEKFFGGEKGQAEDAAKLEQAEQEQAQSMDLDNQENESGASEEQSTETGKEGDETVEGQVEDAE